MRDASPQRAPVVVLARGIMPGVLSRQLPAKPTGRVTLAANRPRPTSPAGGGPASPDGEQPPPAVVAAMSGAVPAKRPPPQSGEPVQKRNAGGRPKVDVAVAVFLVLQSGFSFKAALAQQTILNERNKKPVPQMSKGR